MSKKRKVLKCAKKYTSNGWRVVPVPYKQKAPSLKKWQKLRLSQADLAEYFNEGVNIGVLLGKPSGDLADVDLDCEQAIILAPDFLPPTRRIHGRTSKLDSHYWYKTYPASIPKKFCDLDGTCLVELRSTGQQTIAPPSIHPSGERLRWRTKGRTKRISSTKLLKAVSRLAAATLLARHWPKKGRRNEASMALAGALLRAGWDELEVGRFVARVARSADDEEWRAREAIARTTRKRLLKNAKATGKPRLSALMGEGVIDQACEWLGIDASRVPLDGIRRTEIGWPSPLRRCALYGLAGDFVSTVSPQTEADRAAILIQLLVAFGNACGRLPYLQWGRARHYTNLFCVMVGNTAKSRKGTSWEEVANLFEQADSDWLQNRLQSGLSSGEGLIWAIRDAIEKVKTNKKTGKTERIIEDFGVDDKRLLVLEEEFASALRVIRREGNTLSAVIRNAWGRGNLSALTKNSPARATEAHISIIGHITRNELLRELSENDGSNGFANRFLWVCAKRSRFLPFGGKVDADEISELVLRFVVALEYARRARQIIFSKQSKELWGNEYPRLSADVPGQFGAITSRAEAQVLRLSMLYALLNCSNIVRRRHLRAALAVWEYCRDSARYIFKDSFGDIVVDKILRNLQKSPQGLTRTEIRELFRRNRSGFEIKDALRVLREHGRVRSEWKKTGGRPSRRWFAVR